MGASRCLRNLLQPHGSSGPRGSARIQPSVSGRQSPADERLGLRSRRVGRSVSAVGRVSAGIARSELSFAHRNASCSGRIPAHALCPTVQLRHPARTDARSPAGYRLCRKPRQEAARLSQSEFTSGDRQYERDSVCRRTALPGIRRHSMDGKSRNLRLQLPAGGTGEEILERVLGSGELHLGQSSERCAGSHFIDWRRCRYRHWSFQISAESRQTQSGAGACRIRRAAPASP